ncbi:hypothetical protein BGX26_001765, partial [Mortierella sp. AD094]
LVSTLKGPPARLSRITRSSSKSGTVLSSTSSYPPDLDHLPSLPSSSPPSSPQLPLLPSPLPPPSSASSLPLSHASNPSTSYSSSTSSTKSIPPAVLSRMRDEFSRSFHGYRGNKWTLPSGTMVDDTLFPYVMDMKTESPLHSFIIVGEPDLEPFSKDDGLLIQDFLMESDLTHIDVKLSEWKKAELVQYQLNPQDVMKMLNNGLNNLPPLYEESIDRNEFNASRLCVFSSLFDIWQVYYSQNYKIPLTKNESWYRGIFWGFLWKLFALDQQDQPLTFDPGEKSSKASSNQKNQGRTDPKVQLLQGSKVMELSPAKQPLVSSV